MTEPRKVLVIGFGNPGRLDDGLGPAAAEALEAMRLPGVTVDADYQLNVEDAAAIAAHDAVVFVDAALAGSEPFFFAPIMPQPALGFSSHSVEPEVVVHMAHTMFGATTEAWALGIRGYEFDEFGEGLGEKARANLDAALAFLVEALRSGVFAACGEAPPSLDEGRAN